MRRWLLIILAVGLIGLWVRPEDGTSSTDLRAAYLAQVPQVVPSTGRARPSSTPSQIPAPTSERVLPSMGPVATVSVPTMATPTAPAPASTPPPPRALPAYVVPIQPWSAATVS